MEINIIPRSTWDAPTPFMNPSLTPHTRYNYDKPSFCETLQWICPESLLNIPFFLVLQFVRNFAAHAKYFSRIISNFVVHAVYIEPPDEHEGAPGVLDRYLGSVPVKFEPRSHPDDVRHRVFCFPAQPDSTVGQSDGNHWKHRWVMIYE